MSKEISVTKKQRPICNNCRFGGTKFKIGTLTHLHCENEEMFPKQDFENGKLSPWDTLMEWWSTCKKHEYRSVI